MAKKKKEPKIVLERTYNVPLRSEFIKVPRYKKAKKAVAGLRKFLKRHMKANSLKDIKIGKYANLEIWKHGIKNPPHYINVNVKKNDEGIVFAEIVGAPEEKPKEVKKVKEVKKPEVKEEEKKEVKKEEEKKEVKTPEELRKVKETKEKKEKDKILTKKI